MTLTKDLSRPNKDAKSISGLCFNVSCVCFSSNYYVPDNMTSIRTTRSRLDYQPVVHVFLLSCDMCTFKGSWANFITIGWTFSFNHFMFVQFVIFYGFHPMGFITMEKNTTTWRRSFVFLTNHQTVANLRSCPPFFGCHGEYYPSIPLLKAPDQELPAEIHADMEVTSCYLEAPFFEIFLLKA